MKTFDMPQYSPEWWTIRCGVVTASNMDKVLTAATMKPSAQQDDYIAEIIADKVCLTPNFFRTTTPEMQHGIDTEPEARRWYEMYADLDVQQVGFCLTDDARFGCSPDGLVGDEGGLELKCPQLKTQVKYLLNGGLPNEYKAQVHGSLLVTGRKWWDFVSYAPGLPPLVIRVTPDAYTVALADELERFWEKLRTRWELIKTAAERHQRPTRQTRQVEAVAQF